VINQILNLDATFSRFDTIPDSERCAQHSIIAMWTRGKKQLTV